MNDQDKLLEFLERKINRDCSMEVFNLQELKCLRELTLSATVEALCKQSASIFNSIFKEEPK